MRLTAGPTHAECIRWSSGHGSTEPGSAGAGSVIVVADYANRIVGYEACVDPTTLLGHPENWRIHPKAQQDALKGALEEIGWAAAVTVNVNTQHVVDGHLRASEAISAESCVPVIFVDLTEDEELKMLASFDTITGMAITDSSTLRDIAERISFDSAALSAAVRRAVSSVVREEPEGPNGDVAGAEGAENGSGDDSATPLPPENRLTWGYMTWKSVRVNCSESEVTALNEAYEAYKADNGGLDIGFVRSLLNGD